MEARRKKRRKRKLRSHLGWRLTLVGIVVFLIYNVISAINALSVKTETVEIGQILNAAEKKAVVIRDETVVFAPHEGYVEYLVSQGDRVRKGTNVAVIKSGYDRNELQEKLKLIDYKIQEYSGEATTVNIEDEVNRRNVELQILYADLQKRILSEEREYLYFLKEEILKKNEEKKFLKETKKGNNKSLEELKAEKQSLLSQLNGASYQIKAPAGGVVVAYYDGYEDDFQFKKRNSLTVSQIEKVRDRNDVDLKERFPKGSPVGKIIYNFKYYFACQVDKTDIEHIHSMQPVHIYLDDIVITGYLEDFHKGSDGKFLGLFCVEDELFRFYEKRSYKIKVEYNQEKGLKIPKSSVVKGSLVEEGVYVIDETGTVVLKKLKPVLTEDAEYIICHYDSKKTRADDEVNLYDEVVLNPSKVREGQRLR